MESRDFVSSAAMQNVAFYINVLRAKKCFKYSFLYNKGLFMRGYKKSPPKPCLHNSIPSLKSLADIDPKWFSTFFRM